MVKDLIDVDVYIETVRFRGNGAIFTGRITNSDGLQTVEEIVVRCPGSVLYPREEVFRGEVWAVSGFWEAYRNRSQLGVVKAVLKRPIGENLIAAIAFNPKFAGIGEKKARDLWKSFGEDLYDMLDAEEPDLEALHRILTPEATELLLRVWKDEYSGDLYHWLDQHQIPKSIGRRLQEYYGRDARTKVENDPYRMLAFGQSWAKVDSIARRLGVAEDDPRRLHAAVAEVLYRHFAEGHTAISTDALTSHVASILCVKGTIDQRLANNALRHTYLDGAFVGTDDVWQATGIYLMEAFVANRIRAMLTEQSEQSGLFDSLARHFIDRYNGTQHQLSEEQKEAVRLTLRTNCCVITGGAGTGKTSVLRCVYDYIEGAGGTVLQMALSGRAAKRMEEASGRPAMTIAGFLTKIKKEDLQKITHVTIDEASMLDVVSAFRILRKLPERIKLILVGDPYQLPPIGPGLIFHILAKQEGIPVARLTRVYRQSSSSGIPTISHAIRNGEWPHIPEYSGKVDGVFSLQARTDEITNLLMQIFEELDGDSSPEEVQILSAIKADTPYGVVGINKVFHTRYTEGKSTVLLPLSSGSLRDSGLRQGDRIMVTENQWNRRLFNGSLGYIKEAFKTPLQLEENQFLIAKAVIDGREIELTQDDLRWIVYGYSISVHKSQGSQFRRVIIPLCNSRLLDRTLIYTAVTRAVDQVVLLGDLTAVKSAVEAPPHAWLRQIGFDRIMHSVGNK